MFFWLDSSSSCVLQQCPLAQMPPLTRSQRLLRWLIALPNEDRTSKSSSSNGRNYTHWHSQSTIFLLGGRLRTIKAAPFAVLTFAGLMLPLVLFCIFEAHWWWYNISPAIVITFVYCWILAFVSFLKAAGSDSGTLPKNIQVASSLNPYAVPSEYLNVITLPGKSHDATVKYCSSCRLWRPPRSFHCAKCDQCIVTHDHHCFWLGNCIGERNYRYFFCFLLTAVLSCSYLASMCLYRIFHHDNQNTIKHRLRHAPMSLFNAIYSLLALMYPMLLLGYHVYLAATDQTTREFLRTIHNDEKLNPYEQTGRNYLMIFMRNLCRPRGFSFVRAREKYEDGDQRFNRY